MCSVQLAVAGLNIVSTMQEYKSAKAVSEAQKRANEQTRRNSDQAYLNDISKIDSEAVSASREKTLAEFEAGQKANAAQAKALNLNAGNADKIIQDMAGTNDMQFLDITRDYETDIFKLSSQQTDAYAAQQRRYNSIAPVVMPSRTGAMLKIATQAASGYQAHSAATGGGGLFGTPASPYGDRSLYPPTLEQ
jgi:hypothetical protein